MADGPRDWDKELAEIDRLMQQGGGAGPKPAPPALRGETAPQAPPRGGAPPSMSAPSRRDRIGTWARALAGVAVAAAMTQWPYAHGCGVPLLLYGMAAGAVAVVGVWGAAASWRSRLAAAHIVSLVVLGWGLALIASVVLPRIGYAAETLPWLCP